MSLAYEDPSFDIDIKEETVDGLKLESDDSSFDIPSIQNEFNIIKEEQSSLKFIKEEITEDSTFEFIGVPSVNPIIKNERIVEDEQFSLKDIKEEIIDESELESDDFSFDIPEIKNEYIVKNEQSSLERRFNKSRIAVKNEFNLADAFVPRIRFDNRDDTPEILSGSNRDYRPCDSYGKASSPKIAFIQYAADADDSEGKHTCDVCQKTFCYKCRLIRHAKIHTGEKPYTCDVCQKSFGQKNTLKQHETIHTGEKPYVCIVCKKAFNQKSKLKRHAVIHKEYPMSEMFEANSVY